MENKQLPSTKEKSSAVRNDIMVIVMVFVALVLSMIGSSHFATPDDATTKILWSHKGGLSEPFTVDKDNSLARLEIFRLHPFRSNGWDALKLEVLDVNKQPLGAIAIEFWLERGRDSEGYRYTETIKDARVEYFFAQKGQYYFRLHAESNALNLQKYKHLYQMAIYPDIDANIHFRKLSMLLFILFIVSVLWAVRNLEA